MFSKLFEILLNLPDWQLLGGGGTIVTSIIGFVLKHYKLFDKIKDALAKFKEWAEKWIDDIEQRFLAWLGKTNYYAIKKAGFNTGVAISTWFNKLPVIGWIYEWTIEPVLISVIIAVLSVLIFALDTLARILTALVAWLIKALSAFTNEIPEGMKSDNTNLKTKKNPEGKKIEKDKSGK